MSIKTEFESIITAIEGFFSTDVAPALKTFVTLFASQEGQLILATALVDVGALAAGQPFAAVVATTTATVIAKSEVIAAQDAITTIQQVQAALNVAKIATGTIAPADTAAAAGIAPVAGVSTVSSTVTGTAS